jgi:hypothetical protein
MCSDARGDKDADSLQLVLVIYEIVKLLTHWIGGLWYIGKSAPSTISGESVRFEAPSAASGDVSARREVVVLLTIHYRFRLKKPRRHLPASHR